jgi:hypothetical protein
MMRSSKNIDQRVAHQRWRKQYYLNKQKERLLLNNKTTFIKQGETRRYEARHFETTSIAGTV